MAVSEADRQRAYRERPLLQPLRPSGALRRTGMAINRGIIRNVLVLISCLVVILK
jgi:hypothetical protein